MRDDKDWWVQCQRCFREAAYDEGEEPELLVGVINGEVVCFGCMTQAEQSAVEREQWGEEQWGYAG